MQAPVSDRHIFDWDETDVHNWFSSLGYPHYEAQIREHKIQGDTLCELDSDALKSLGVTSAGRRLSILRSIYLVKVAHNVPIDETHYIPPSADRGENINMEKLNSVVKEQAQRLRILEESNQNLSAALQSFIDEVNHLRSSMSQPTDENSLQRQPSFNWEVKPQKSPTKADNPESPFNSPQRPEHDIPAQNRAAGPSIQNTPADKPKVNTTETPSKPTKPETENLKSFKVSLEDPTWKVLPAALKKYRVHNETWQNYAMFICYGPSGNRIERCLSYDEKPLLLFQKLKDAKKNPVFMLKHIRDIRSPIAVAQQKHAARKASSVISQETTVTTTATVGHHRVGSTSRGGHRPPKLEVQDLSTPTPTTGINLQPGWENNGSGSSHNDDAAIPSSASTQVSHLTVSSTNYGGSTLVVPSPNTSTSQDATRSKSDGDDASNGGGTVQSYAVAIYPYMAEQDDEFDVVVGDTFIILSRARGWWVVQRDLTGSGTVDPDTAKHGWVPAGCLLETNVPVASAIAEAMAAAKKSPTDEPETSVSKTPILPLSIVSTSFPGIALISHSKRGEDELDLMQDDLLRVFKRYNHWSYAVKEVGGDRGWVPSWYIGKVSATGVTPLTPNTSTNLDDNSSPMSPAFPP